MAQKITLRDVALHAGVSVTTVSNVVRNWQYVSPEMRLKVQKAIHDLGYTPNLIAQGLRTGRTQMIGFIAPDLINPHFTAMISTAEDIAQERGYSVLVFNTHNNQTREAERINRALNSSVDGLLVVPTSDVMYTVNLLQSAPMPIVYLDRISDSFEGAFCKVDNFELVQIPMRHLYDLGHRKIALLSGPQNTIPASERLYSYWQFVEHFGLTYHHVSENNGSWSSEEGYRVTAALLDSSHDHPTAILSSNDSMAIGASHAIRERGLQIPDDISLVGIDDIEVSKYMNPSLTTVQQPVTEMAEVSVGMLLDFIQGHEPESIHFSLMPRIVIRKSTASPRSNS